MDNMQRVKDYLLSTGRTDLAEIVSFSTTARDQREKELRAALTAVLEMKRMLLDHNNTLTADLAEWKAEAQKTDDMIIGLSSDLAAATLRADAAQEELRKAREQVPVGWRPSLYDSKHDPRNAAFSNGLPDDKTITYWAEAGIDIEYCYAAPVPAQPQPDRLAEAVETKCDGWWGRDKETGLQRLFRAGETIPADAVPWWNVGGIHKPAPKVVNVEIEKIIDESDAVYSDGLYHVDEYSLKEMLKNAAYMQQPQPVVFAPGSLDGKENTKTVRVELTQPAPEGMALAFGFLWHIAIDFGCPVPQGFSRNIDAGYAVRKARQAMKPHLTQADIADGITRAANIIDSENGNGT